MKVRVTVREVRDARAGDGPSPVVAEMFEELRREHEARIEALARRLRRKAERDERIGRCAHEGCDRVLADTVRLLVGTAEEALDGLRKARTDIGATLRAALAETAGVVAWLDGDIARADVGAGDAGAEE